MPLTGTRDFHSDMPLLPLRDVVVYPHMVIPLFVGRPKSIRALEQRFGDPGRTIAALGQVPQTVAVETHESSLGAGEKC